MSGGIMQLISYGAQDIYIFGNPQVTFFKAVYKRYTNFAFEATKILFNKKNPTFGDKTFVTIKRNGDLVGASFIEVTLPEMDVNDANGFAWDYNIGIFLIKSVELEIGGNRIDKLYPNWVNIWVLLSIPNGQLRGFNQMIGNISTLTTFSILNTFPETVLTIPLFFSFCTKAANALPLIALQYHDVRLNVEFETFANLVSKEVTTLTVSEIPLVSAVLYVDYYYLDVAERRRFVTNPCEYLFHQLQFYGPDPYLGTRTAIDLRQIDNSVKELFWILKSSDQISNASYSTINTLYRSPIDNSELLLNSYSVFGKKSARYTNLMVPYQRHSNCGLHRIAATSEQFGSPSGSTGINVFSFALEPENHQPTGTLNFSRINNPKLYLEMSALAISDFGTNVSFEVYALSYNVLRVMSGMANLAYAS